VLVRVALTQVFRRRIYWLVLLLGIGNFLKAVVGIYFVTQAQMPENMRATVLERFGFSDRAEEGQESGYTKFMEQQSLVVMMLLAFSGSLLVGADFRQQVLPFYLSRRIDRRHYIVGKLLAVSAIVALLTVVPALLLFVEYGLFSSSFDYWWQEGHVLGAVMIYGIVLCSVLGIWLVTLSAYLQRGGPIAVAWASMFLLLGQLAGRLADETDDKRWQLLDPWFDIHHAGRLLFGDFKSTDDRELAQWAAVILAISCALCLAALVRRVRAVDVVQ
jgi:ABC-type transport system involved in multi-copper enzyme maturation permease subunit